MHSGYDVFVSYAHEDRRAVATLCAALQRIARPLLRPRALDVYLDSWSERTGGSLGAKLSRALRDSAVLLVVASPDAAESEWTEMEASAFLADPRERPVLIALVRGDAECGSLSGLVPPSLAARCAPDEHFVDLRFLSETPAGEPDDGRVVNAIVPLAAAIHAVKRGRPVAPEELVGETARNVRRVRRLTRAGLLTLTAFLLLALGLFVRAERARAETARQLGISDARGRAAVDAFAGVVAEVSRRQPAGDAETMRKELLAIAERGYERIAATTGGELEAEAVRLARVRGDVHNLNDEFALAHDDYSRAIELGSELPRASIAAAARDVAIAHTRLADLALRVSLKQTRFGYDRWSWDEMPAEGEFEPWWGPTIAEAMGGGVPAVIVAFPPERLEDARAHLEQAERACRDAAASGADPSRGALDLAFVLAKRADVAYFRGELDEAKRLAAASTESCGSLPEHTLGGYEASLLRAKNALLEGWIAGSHERDRPLAAERFREAKVLAERASRLRATPFDAEVARTRRDAAMTMLARPTDGAGKDGILAALARTAPTDEEIRVETRLSDLEAQRRLTERDWLREHAAIFFEQPDYYRSPLVPAIEQALADAPPALFAFSWWSGAAPSWDQLETRARWQTAGAWDQLASGLSLSEVTQILGEPTSTQSIDSLGMVTDESLRELDAVFGFDEAAETHLLYESSTFGVGHVWLDTSGRVRAWRRPWILR